MQEEECILAGGPDYQHYPWKTLFKSLFLMQLWINVGNKIASLRGDFKHKFSCMLAVQVDGDLTRIKMCLCEL